MELLLTITSYLQSSDSKLGLNQSDAAYEHGLASVTCLLSGARVLCPSTTEQSRLLRVIHGLHGFHLYATEHWIGYILMAAADDSNNPSRSEFLDQSCELARALEKQPRKSCDHEGEATLPEEIDKCLVALREKHGALYNLAKAILQERREGKMTAPSHTEEEGMYLFMGYRHFLCQIFFPS